MSLWSWEKKEDNSYKDAVDNVKLQQKINYLEAQLEKYKTRVEGEFASATFSVDWASMNAFSVERTPNGEGTFNTVIGYMMAEPFTTVENNVTYKDVVREWTLRCSHQEHERLVAEFNLYKASK